MFLLILQKFYLFHHKKILDLYFVFLLLFEFLNHVHLYLLKNILETINFFKSCKKISNYTRISMTHMWFCRWIINRCCNIIIFIHLIIYLQILKKKFLNQNCIFLIFDNFNKNNFFILKEIFFRFLYFYKKIIQ